MLSPHFVADRADYGVEDGKTCASLLFFFVFFSLLVKVYR